MAETGGVWKEKRNQHPQLPVLSLVGLLSKKTHRQLEGLGIGSKGWTPLKSSASDYKAVNNLSNTIQYNKAGSFAET